MNNSEIKILVVEDDIQIQKFISYLLKKEQFQYICSNNAHNALNIFSSEKIDLIVLDLGLPDMDGIDLIKKIREWSEVPIVVVSARDQDKEKVSALDSGADDYLTKPFSANELMARVRVALRHYSKNNISPIIKKYTIGELTIDFDKRLVFIKDDTVHLTPMEYSLLSLLFKNIGKVLTTKYIIREIWGIGYGTDTQVLRTLMAGLRRKIEKNPAKPQYILTEIGVGYRLIDE